MQRLKQRCRRNDVTRRDLTGERLSERKFNFGPRKSRKDRAVIALGGRVSRRPRSDGETSRTRTTRTCF